MKKFGAIFLCGMLLLAGAAEAAEAAKNDVFSGRDAMNGYSLDQYKDFLNWHLVTVRFRHDTGEMRFTYANDLAWATMQKKSIDYPDGAVFAKIGIGTEDDPDFTSSAVPSGARRYQLMVMDRAKHPETHGWGYALFDMSGKTYPEDPKDIVKACNACHELVPQRGYVFSQPMRLRVGAADSAPTPPTGEKPIRMRFDTIDVPALPETVRMLIPETMPKVRQLRGPLETNAFEGTLDEVRPFLSAEAARSRLPTILIHASSKRFVLEIPQLTQPCQLGGETGMMMKGFYINPAGKLTRAGENCQLTADGH